MLYLIKWKLGKIIYLVGTKNRMPKFGRKSRASLETCDERLQKVFNEVVKTYDCTVVCGHRGEEDQNKAFNEGRSKVKYPNGRHNASPSKAADVTPYPVDWEDRERFIYFGGFVKGCAFRMGISLRWGGEWNQYFEVDDNQFDDFPHFELMKGF